MSSQAVWPAGCLLFEGLTEIEPSDSLWQFSQAVIALMRANPVPDVMAGEDAWIFLLLTVLADRLQHDV